MAAFDGRGERIRTSDPLVPNQVLYQAEPLPEHFRQHAYQRVRPGTMIRWIRSHECSRIRRHSEPALRESKLKSRHVEIAAAQIYFFSSGVTAPGKMPSRGARSFSIRSG